MTHYLARRANWQLKANQDGSLAEADVIKVLKSYLDSVYPGEYEVRAKPLWFGQPYLEMDYEDNPELYTKPEVPVKGNVWFDTERNLFMEHNGKKTQVIRETFEPDTGILHIPSGRRYIIECKNQQPKGNAHERACKYTTLSMMDFIKKKLGVDYHPVGYIFSGGMVENEGYCRELRAFFKFSKGHLLLWKENRSPILLTNWLESTVLPLLRGPLSQSE